MATTTAEPDRSTSTARSIGTLGRRERRREEIRGRLYRSALALFMTRGLQATTVKDITEAADVGKGTFFNYFPSKEHVLVLFYGQQRGRVEDALRAVRKGEPVRKALATLMRRLSEEAQHPALTRGFLQAIASSGVVSDLVMPQLQLRQQLYEQLLLVGQRRGEIRRDRPAAELARGLLELAFGTALFWSCRPKTPLPELLDANLDLICAASPRRPKPRRRTARRSVRRARQAGTRRRQRFVTPQTSSIPQRK